MRLGPRVAGRVTMRQTGAGKKGETRMRVVLIGVSHWHTPFFLDPCLEMADVTIVGVSDPDLSRAEPLAAKAGCKAFPDYQDMCATVKPDFAFALAPHHQMAALARFLIDA